MINIVYTLTWYLGEYYGIGLVILLRVGIHLNDGYDKNLVYSFGNYLWLQGDFKNPPQNITRSLRIVTTLPLPGSDGLPFRFVDTMYLTETGDFNVYQYKGTSITTEIKRNSAGNLAPVLVESHSYNLYYVYQTGSSFGFTFGTGGDADGRRLAVDTFNYQHSFHSPDIIYRIARGGYAMTDFDNSMLFVPKLPGDHSAGDSLFISFTDKLDGYRFSLSPYTDSLKGKRMNSYRMVINSNPSAPSPYMQAAKEVGCSLSVVPPDDIDSVNFYINKYKLIINRLRQ